MNLNTVVVAAILAAGSVAFAQPFVTLPSQFAESRGQGGISTLIRSAPRTYQMQFVESELAAQGVQPGMVITGLAWRLSVSSNNPQLWPASDAIWQNYDIRLAQAAFPPAQMSTTFADNMLTPVLVRHGPLTIPAAMFENDDARPAPGANPWGFEVALQPYFYRGGDLVVHITHSGSNLSGVTYLDAASSSLNPGRALSANSYNAEVSATADSSMTITRFIVAPGPHATSPLGREALRGSGATNTLMRDAGQPRTYQMQLLAADLAGQGLTPGMAITGIAWRASAHATNPGSWPQSPAMWQNYNITLAQATNPAHSLSTTFADNMQSPLLVRSGPLTIPAGAFRNVAGLVSPERNPWGFEIRFLPYIYQGGDLVVHIAHDGSDLVNNALLLDAQHVGAPYGAAISATQFNAEMGGVTNTMTISRLTFAPQETAIIPAANRTTAGTTQYNGLTSSSGSSRTYQMQIPEAELAAEGIAPGATLTGIAWRARAVAHSQPVWPLYSLTSGGAAFHAYDITLARAAHPIASMNANFASNMLDPVLVRGGAMTIPNGAFVTDPSIVLPDPNPWSFEVVFEPYTYDGGDLIVHITHTGSNLASSAFLFDGVTSNTSTGRALAAEGYDAQTSTLQATFVISRFSFIPASGPGPCYANCDGSTVEPVLNVDDFTCFINTFAAAQALPHQEQITHYANCDNSTTAPVLNVDDFTCFINAFAAGCQ